VRADIIEQTREARDFHALTRGVLAVCEPYGPVHSFKLVHSPGAAKVACIIELKLHKQQSALARAIGGRALNGSVCVEIPVRKDFEARPKVAA
jgi:hypothetical protein